ncbi:MAG TPA: SAM-dependent methyltransferase [Bryobacteraceae bacterium]|nr:SAM-dependent methyltransferase [Bryobacteraceae bacterium]
MTPAAEILAEEIRRGGPIPFRRFMEVALYHPEHGYYRRRPDPFGAQGDFYTAEQIQPVFGILIAARIRQLYRELGGPADFTVVELGAGRCEMAPHFAGWRYIPVEVGQDDALPDTFAGVVFSNEFFDALPVDVAIFTGGAFREELVGFRDGRFEWTPGGEVCDEAEDYIRRYFPEPAEGCRYEVNLSALHELGRAARLLSRGFVFTIDYGYTRAESVRFPEGTLMSYRRHIARTDVLEDPGERDLTAHVNFTALEEFGATRGLALDRFETLARTLLTAGEADRFAAALGEGEGVEGAEALRRRMQLKTLLFGMGETFRVQLLRKEERRA